MVFFEALLTLLQSFYKKFMILIAWVFLFLCSKVNCMSLSSIGEMCIKI